MDNLEYFVWIEASETVCNESTNVMIDITNNNFNGKALLAHYDMFHIISSAKDILFTDNLFNDF